MSTTITTAQVQQYAANVRMLFQQEGSLLRSYVWEKELNGKFRFFERLAATNAVLRTTRHGDTPLVEQVHSRRRVDGKDFEWADLIDVQDDIRILIDPQGPYAINAAYALGRSLDDEIISAFNRASSEGEDGSTSTALPSAQVIVNGGTGLTIAKLRQAKRILDLATVPSSERCIVISPIGLEDLLATTEVTSADFNTVRALVMGDLDTFLGFKFLMSTRLPISGNIRSAFAWHKSTMGIAMGQDIRIRTSERADKSYAMQVYASATFGAVRVEDAGVVQVDFDETA
jgi:hypothetical protein